MKRIFSFIFSVFLALCANCQVNEQPSDAFNELQVEGTEMAKLPYVMDVLRQMPRLTFNYNAISIIGIGEPDIYVDNRKITSQSELSQIPANQVKSIKVLLNPSAEYDKNVQAVIVIRLIDNLVGRGFPSRDSGNENNGLKLDETLRLDLTHKLSTNNELRLGWKQDAFTLGAFVAFNEENKNFEKTGFKYYYKNQELTSREESSDYPDIYKQVWTGRLNAAYSISENHSLSARYSMTNTHINRTYLPQASQSNREPETRHDISLEYAGKFGAWNLTIGNNTFFDDATKSIYKPSGTGYHLHNEYDVRTYTKAKAPLWKGDILLGTEFEYDFLEMDQHDDEQASSAFINNYGGIHAEHPDNTFALFASTTQKFGQWTLEGGLRYEYRSSIYQPCSDDGLMKFINQNVDASELFAKKTDDNPFFLLAERGRLHTSFHQLYPTLKVSTNVGKSQFVLSYSRSSVRPYLGLTRLTVKDLEDDHIDDKLLLTEKVHTTLLNWKYRWINVSTSFVRYEDPICGTSNGDVKYNAPDYNALNVVAILVPHIGIWNPMLSVSMHKQWFDMPLANGKDKLSEMLFNVDFNNTISLPSNWLILAGANWHSKGAERNWHYHSPNLSLSTSVQKSFPKQGITLQLSAVNLLRDSYSDITRYTQAYYGLSQGARDQNVRMVSLSINYKL